MVSVALRIIVHSYMLSLMFSNRSLSFPLFLDICIIQMCLFLCLSTHFMSTCCTRFDLKLVFVAELSEHEERSSCGWTRSRTHRLHLLLAVSRGLSSLTAAPRGGSPQLKLCCSDLLTFYINDY